MLLSPSSSFHMNIFIKDKKIEQVDNIRYLGVVIDSKLNWNLHVQNLAKLLAKKLFALRKMSPFLDLNLLNLMYKTIIQPNFDYSCSVWGNCSMKNKQILTRLQKRAARIVTNNFDYESTDGLDIVQSLKWQSFEQRRDYFLALLMYTCIHGLAPTRMCNSIEMNFDRHGFNTRASDSFNVVLPKPNLECFKQSFMYAGGKLWNTLSHAVQNSTSIISFKCLCKKVLFN